MSDYTDLQIVQDLVDIGCVTQNEQAIWKGMEGYDTYQGFELNRLFGVGTRRLQQIARGVRVKIVVRREMIRSGRVKWGHSLGQGKKVRWSPDKTASGEDVGSSWNKDRIEAAHAGSRRKPAAPAPRGKRKPPPPGVRKAG